MNGQRIAVIGATQVLDDELISAWTAGPGKPGLASAKDVPRLVRAVRQARATSDTVVVFLHWGVELAAVPVAGPAHPRQAARRRGRGRRRRGHAHRVQGAGRMGSALVDYGLGNFVWYGTSELSTRTGVLVVTVDGRRVLGYRWVPARIVDGTPRPLPGSERAPRARVVEVAARLHRPEPYGPGLHLAGRGPLAQLVEQGTLNPKVEGSNPSRPIRGMPANTGVRTTPSYPTSRSVTRSRCQSAARTRSGSSTM